MNKLIPLVVAIATVSLPILSITNANASNQEFAPKISNKSKASECQQLSQVIRSAAGETIKPGKQNAANNARIAAKAQRVAKTLSSMRFQDTKLRSYQPSLAQYYRRLSQISLQATNNPKQSATSALKLRQESAPLQQNLIQYCSRG